MLCVVFTLIVILLFVNGTVKIMIHQLISSDFFTKNIESLGSNLATLTTRIDNLLYSTDNELILFVIFLSLILVSAFFVIVFIVTKIFAMMGRKNKRIKAIDYMWDENNDDEEESRNDELEYELQSELSKQDIDETEDLINTKKDKEENIVPFENLNVRKNSFFEENIKEKNENPKEKSFIPLDWERTKKYSEENNIQNEKAPNSTTLRKNIRDLIHIIVNMIGRNIDELKIAQTIMFHKNDEWSEEAVMQLVLSIKEFINLCNRGAFNHVRKQQNLPTEEDAILHLLIGDTSYAMALMEALIDEQINFAVELKNISQRESVFNQTSYYSCYFGTLAEVNDVNLAAASFELAIEMSPKNTLAWSRCADTYKKIGLEEKANRAYNNVLKIAIDDNEFPQKANAYKHLSQYFYAHGDSEQALHFYTQSKSFYDSIGINRPMDRKELEIIELIETANDDSIVKSVLYDNQKTL